MQCPPRMPAECQASTCEMSEDDVSTMASGSRLSQTPSRTGQCPPQTPDEFMNSLSMQLSQIPPEARQQLEQAALKMQEQRLPTKAHFVKMKQQLATTKALEQQSARQLELALAGTEQQLEQAAVKVLGQPLSKWQLEDIDQQQPSLRQKKEVCHGRASRFSSGGLTESTTCSDGTEVAYIRGCESDYQIGMFDHGLNKTELKSQPSRKAQALSRWSSLVAGMLKQPRSNHRVEQHGEAPTQPSNLYEWLRSYEHAEQLSFQTKSKIAQLFLRDSSWAAAFPNLADMCKQHLAAQPRSAWAHTSL